MSIALSTARANVIQLIRDVDRAQPAVQGYVIDQAISNHLQAISGRVWVPLAWTTLSALTVGDADYTLSGGSAKEFHTIGLFRLTGASLTTENRAPLVEKVSPETLERLRGGGTAQKGEPLILSVIEANPSSVGTTETTFTLWPAPDEVYTLEGLASEIPAVASADTDKIQLGLFGQRAIEYAAAAELLMAMPDAEAARIGISKNVASQYAGLAERYVDSEQTRISRQRSSRMANASRYGY